MRKLMLVSVLIIGLFSCKKEKSVDHIAKFSAAGSSWEFHKNDELVDPIDGKCSCKKGDLLKVFVSTPVGSAFMNSSLKITIDGTSVAEENSPGVINFIYTVK